MKIAVLVRSDLGGFVLGTTMLIATASFHAWLSHGIMQKRYSIRALYQQRQEWVQTVQWLEAQYREMSALPRLDILAQRYFHLFMPQTGQVLYPPSPSSPPSVQP